MWYDIFFSETREQKQAREYKEALAKKDHEYKESLAKKSADKAAAKALGESAGHIRVTFHPEPSMAGKWVCCGARVRNVADDGCEEKWVSKECHILEACSSGCGIHTFSWKGVVYRYFFLHLCQLIVNLSL